MKASDDFSEMAERFALVAAQFCTVVDAVSGLDRSEFCAQIYGLLPKLIDQAIAFSEIASNYREQDVEDGVAFRERVNRDVKKSYPKWKRHFDRLSDVLGDWNAYREVFDPYADDEPIKGCLADDLAGMYMDLSKVLVDTSMAPRDRIWRWRFSFCTHWGHHAIDALRAIHSRLHYH